MNVILRKFKTASAFSLQQWQILLFAYFLFLKVRWLRFFRTPQSVVRALSTQRLKPYSPPQSKRQLLKLLHLAARYQPGKPNCLTIALAQHAFLFHFGVPSRFRIGVRKVKAEFKAHAWCEDSAIPDTQRPKQHAILEPIS